MLFEADFRTGLGQLQQEIAALKDADIVPGLGPMSLPIGRRIAGGRNFSALDRLMERFADCLSRRMDPNSTATDGSWMKHPPSRSIDTALSGVYAAQPGDFMTVILPSDITSRISNAKTFPPNPNPNITIISEVHVPFLGRFADREARILVALYQSHPRGAPSRHIEIASMVDIRALTEANRGVVYASREQSYLANKYGVKHPLSGGRWGENS